MLVRAKVSFAGKSISMIRGSIKNIKNENILNDLIKANYIELIDEQTKNETAINTKNRTAKKKNESK